LFTYTYKHCEELTFLSLDIQLFLPQSIKNNLQVLQMRLQFGAINENVIEIDDDKSAHK
jgi:hypothetical protein